MKSIILLQFSALNVKILAPRRGDLITDNTNKWVKIKYLLLRRKSTIICLPIHWNLIRFARGQPFVAKQLLIFADILSYIE